MERQRATADSRNRLLDLAAHRRGEPLGAPTHDSDLLVQHPQDRDLLKGALRLEIEQ